MGPSRIVANFLEAFFSGRIDDAAAMVREDFSFRAPLLERAGDKTAYFASAHEKARFISGLRILRQWAEGDEVSTLYDIDVRTPQGTATMAISEWHTVKDASWPPPSWCSTDRPKRRSCSATRSATGTDPIRNLSNSLWHHAAFAGPEGTSMSRLSGRAGLAAVISALALCLCGFTTTTTDPAKAEVVTSDVANFWRAFDDAAKVPAAQRVDVYRNEYFGRGSQGLKDFDAQRHVTPESLAAHVEQHRAEYAKLRPYINEVVDQKPVIQAAFRRLAALYPGIKLPAHVYFVVGPQHGAGMNSPNGIILAADVFATPPGTPYEYTRITPAYVPFAAVHETIHFNQTYETGDSSTLLQQVINEGTADFITTLVLPQPDVRQMTDRWRFGCPREQALYARFAKEKDKVETSPWLFDHHPSTGWPPDMGYWLGYRIAQTYYHRVADKHQTLADLLQVTDFRKLLDASGYPGKAPKCVAEKPQP